MESAHPVRSGYFQIGAFLNDKLISANMGKLLPCSVVNSPIGGHKQSL
jgi:hypothetical protein